MKSAFGGSRMGNILLYLCRTPAVSAGELAARLDVSERTVRSDLKQLGEELKGCAAVESRQGKYTLRIYDSEGFRAARDRLTEDSEDLNSPRKRMDYVFGRLMRAEDSLLTDELAYEMNIGRSTLISDLKKLRSELEPYRLSIQGKTSKGLFLRGSESDIRHYVLERAYDPLYQNYPLDQEILVLARESFDSSPFEQGVREEFIRFLTVMLDRLLTGHPIEELSPAFYGLSARPEFGTISELTGRLARFLHVEIPVEEALFVFLPIVGMHTPADALAMRSIQLDPAMAPLERKIFRQIRLETNLRLDDPEFEEEFLYHLMFMLNRLRFRVRLSSPILDELREKYPLAWRMAGIAARVIQEEYRLEVTEDERSFLASYFGVFLEEQGKGKRAYQVAVVCGTGRVTARLVAAQLRRVLDSSAQLTLFARERVSPQALEGFDLVFTTVELPCPLELPVIYIHEVFNEQELRHKIEKAKYWDQVDVPILDNNWFVMVGLLDESRFFVLDRERTYDQALARMAGELEKRGQVDTGFLERLRAREEMGSTVFDKGVAIPHTVQYAGERLVLAVGVFPRPVPYGERELQVIFLMGLPQELTADDGLLIRVYEEIISITKDPEMLEKIAQAREFQSLIQALYRRA